MKKLLMALILISTSGTLFAKQLAGTLFAKRLANKPEFEENYIKMAAKGFLCGQITLKSIPDLKVRVMSRHFSEETRGPKIVPGKILSKSDKDKKKKNGKKMNNYWVEVDPGGMRIRYDSAGSGLYPSSHYRVFCQVQNERGNWINIACSKVLTLEVVKHNKACVIGPAGPSASYSPLNMKT